MDHFKAYLLKDVMGGVNLFDDLDREVEWHDDVKHLGGVLPRLFALQAEIVDDLVPLYRHPLDDFPVVRQFTPTVDQIRRVLEDRLGVKFNHAIIQEYRNGEDFISEHSDKTLDIVPSSLIVGYSAGETRTMKFRSKDPVIFEDLKDLKDSDSNLCRSKGSRHRRHVDGENVYQINDMLLVNDSAMILDLETNRYYKHSIRSNSTITQPRISITFRKIGTFYNQKTGQLVGQGYPKDGSDGMTCSELLEMWSRENSSSSCSWSELYARGYSRIGMKN